MKVIFTQPFLYSAMLDIYPLEGQTSPSLTVSFIETDTYTGRPTFPVPAIIRPNISLGHNLTIETANIIIDALRLATELATASPEPSAWEVQRRWDAETFRQWLDAIIAVKKCKDKIEKEQEATR